MAAKSPIVDVQTLPKLSGFQLLKLWRGAFGQAAKGIRQQLLIPCLAYRLQEKACGHSLNKVKRNLERMIAAKTQGARPTPNLKAGTQLTRRWKGETHHVVETDRGYEYSGTRYGSLSIIARKIAGTRWSGPVCFGLRRKALKVSR